MSAVSYERRLRACYQDVYSHNRDEEFVEKISGLEKHLSRIASRVFVEVRTNGETWAPLLQAGRGICWMDLYVKAIKDSGKLIDPLLQRVETATEVDFYVISKITNKLIEDKVVEDEVQAFALTALFGMDEIKRRVGNIAHKKRKTSWPQDISRDSYKIARYESKIAVIDLQIFQLQVSKSKDLESRRKLEFDRKPRYQRRLDRLLRKSAGSSDIQHS